GEVLDGLLGRAALEQVVCADDGSNAGRHGIAREFGVAVDQVQPAAHELDLHHHGIAGHRAAGHGPAALTGTVERRRRIVKPVNRSGAASRTTTTAAAAVW